MISRVSLLPAVEHVRVQSESDTGRRVITGMGGDARQRQAGGGRTGGQNGAAADGIRIGHADFPRLPLKFSSGKSGLPSRQHLVEDPFHDPKMDVWQGQMIQITPACRQPIGIHADWQQ
jgi:hypothetical protein